MQQAAGTFKMLSDKEVDEATVEGYGGRILHVGDDVSATNNNGIEKGYVILSIGERFVRVRALSGMQWGLKIGSEVTIEECAFVVRGKNRKELLLEGVPPEPTKDER